MTLTFGSLFAGIGGMDLGLERAGMVCRWQVEIDDYCRRVLAKHWPDVRKYGDIREVTGGELERVDLICGGFPCQDISNAGKRAGIDGERSGLWSEYIRLVRVLRPRYVLVENVAALLGRGLGTVLGDLAASGYGAEWDCIPAAAVGAPHRRDRLFVVAYDESSGRGARGPRRPANGRQGQPESQQSVQTLADAGGIEGGERYNAHQERGWEGHAEQAGMGSGGIAMAHPDRAGLALRQRAFRERPQPAAAGGGWWATEPDVGRVAHGVPARVHRLRGLGNAVVPQVAEWIGRRILEVA
jgi:DNA (cytosine-5)-methyltransferase 1